MIKLQQIREQIVIYGNRLLAEHLTEGTTGNLSIYDPESGLMGISPSGLPYPDTAPEDVVLMKLDGQIVDGSRKPSSEYALHTVFYQKRPQARAVVHCHSMFATTLSCMGETIRPAHYAIAQSGVDTLPVASYHTYGTRELADAVGVCLDEEPETKAVLMANHGLTVCGGTMETAFALAKTCEWSAELQWRCMAAGTPKLLNRAQMEVVAEKFKSYGQ